MVDAGFGFGNGRVMPAGPLREPVADGLARAGLVLAIGPPAARRGFAARGRKSRRCPGSTARWRPLATGHGLAGPARARLRRHRPAGEVLRHPAGGRGRGGRGARASPTTRPTASGCSTRLEADARARGAQLVTTEKDAARLPPSFRGAVLVLPVRLRLEDWSGLDAALDGLGLGAK